MSASRDDDQLFDAERVVFFSDAVFAIAMTLLVLDLKVPDLGAQASPEAVRDALVAKIPNFVAFVLSFAIVGMLWVTHHGRFERVRRIDLAGIQWSLALLFFVALLPMPTALVFQPTAHSPWPVVIYALNVAGAFLMLNLLWRHLHRRGLSGTSAEVYHRRQLLTSPVWVIFLLSVPFAFLDSRIPYLLWMLLAPIQVVLGRRTRGAAPASAR